MEILLTNDDGYDSPLFLLALEGLSGLGNVTAVVPREEQSWTGKGMKRFGRLRLDEVSVGGKRVRRLSGTPADCANFGIYHLFEGKPDLVVSGINMGSNVGIGFALSSGTVGACLEANLAGAPAVALSQVLGREAFRFWAAHRRLPEEDLARLRAQCNGVLDRVFETLLGRADFRSEPVTWSVNAPFEVAAGWDLVQTFLGHTVYGSCFKPDGAGFKHEIDSPAIDERAGSDGVVVREGHVSMTRLDIRTFGQ